MEDAELHLLLRYPLISKTFDENGIVYKGSVRINDEDYEIRVTELNGTNFYLTVPDEVKPIKENLEALIDQLHPKNIITILDTFVSFVTSKLLSTKLINHSDVYMHILYEYSDFTRFYLNLKSCCLAYDLSEISVTTVDQEGREHSVVISVTFSETDLFNVKCYDLPQDQEVFKKSFRLKEVYDQFLGAIQMFQCFFDVMDEFDMNCWVLDPVKPKRNCNYRRIWMSDNFSVIITFDPTNVSKLPEIKFLGPERLVEEYRNTLNANLADWEPKNGVLSEILRLLGLESFPQKPVTENRTLDLLMESGDCSICFSLRLNDKLPEVICKNKTCEKCYHAECLYEWLMSVNARRFFAEVVGLCPNCEKNITCPIPK